MKHRKHLLILFLILALTACTQPTAAPSATLPDSYSTRYVYSNTTRVNQPQLISDITFGRGSLWIVPVPADLVRGLGIELAIYWSWIMDI